VKTGKDHERTLLAPLKGASSGIDMPDHRASPSEEGNPPAAESPETKPWKKIIVLFSRIGMHKYPRSLVRLRCVIMLSSPIILHLVLLQPKTCHDRDLKIDIFMVSLY
jgi:hypothetical protein